MQRDQAENRTIIVDGQLRKASEPILHADAPALQFGHAFFETLVAFHGKIFLLEQHLERLKKTASYFDLSCPSDHDLISALSQAIAANHFDSEPKTRLRITLAANQKRGTTWVIEATQAPAYPKSANACLLPFARNEQSALVGHKTINYGDNVIAQKFVQEQHCDEGIFPNTHGNLCEGIWSNLFFKLDGKIFTPPVRSGCLPGITRALLLTLAENTGNPIHEEDIPVTSLPNVESAWSTSTLRGMQLIHSIDGRELPDPEPEEWKRLFHAYHERVESSHANS